MSELAASAGSQVQTSRDISPENVLVARTGAVKVVDFGVARGALGAQHRTQAGAAPHYSTG